MSLGYIRVSNARRDMAPDTQPEEGEAVVFVDRTNPVLGNHKHVLRNKLDRAERDRVIAAYARDLDADIAVKGPMYKAIVELAMRVWQGEQIVLMCHCKPLPCHGDVIADRVMWLVAEWREAFI